jgi:DNA-directed RNA polymerase specialized sigma54-like protein
MTPPLQQAIRLLGLSSAELQELERQELQANPRLEAASPDGAGEGPGTAGSPLSGARHERGAPRAIA